MALLGGAVRSSHPEEEPRDDFGALGEAVRWVAGTGRWASEGLGVGDRPPEAPRAPALWAAFPTSWVERRPHAGARWTVMERSVAVVHACGGRSDGVGFDAVRTPRLAKNAGRVMGRDGEGE